MSFLNPILLYAGLACIAVPIIVHLLTRRRRKPIEWAAMRFLLEAYKKHRKRLTLEQLLLLAARCALVALIALALGKPILGAAGLLGTSGPRTLYLLLDNSLAGSALDSAGTSALARHKQRAAKLLDQLDQSRGDRAALLTLGSPAESVVMPPSSDLPAVARLVEAIEPTDSRADLAGAIDRLKSELDSTAASKLDQTTGPTTLAVLSDFLSGSADIDRPLQSLAAGLSIQRSLSVLAAPAASVGPDNITITRAEPLRTVLLSSESGPAQPDIPEPTNPVRVSLTRSGPGVGTAAITQVSVRIDSGPTLGTPAKAQVRWMPGQAEASVVVAATIPSQPANSTNFLAVVAEIDRDSIAGDNTFRRPTETRRTIQVGLLTPPGQSPGTTIASFRPVDWLRLALQPVRPDARRESGTTGLRLIDVDPRAVAQPGVLAGLDALLVTAPDALVPQAWTRLGDYTRAGGFLVVFPPAEAKVHLWPDAMTAALGLDWTIAREPQPTTSGELVEPNSSAPSTSQTASGSADLLAILAGELPELLKPVRLTQLLAINTKADAGETILRSKDGPPLLVISAPGSPSSSATNPQTATATTAPTRTGRGLVALWAVAPDLRWTDLPTKPLMVPLMQELVRQGVGKSLGVWSGPAGSAPPVPDGTRELRFLSSSPSATAHSDDLLSVNAGTSLAPPIRRAGLWRALDVRGTSLGLLAINADPAAGKTETRSTAQLTRWLGTIAGEDRLSFLLPEATPGTPTGSPSDSPSGTSASQPNKLPLGDDQRPPISVPLLLAAAAVALVELVLARVFSHASVHRSLNAVQAPKAMERAA